MHRRVGVELADQRQQFGFAHRIRQTMIERAHAGFDGLLALVAHVDGARRILADQHDREARHEAVLARQPRDFGADLRAQRLRDGLAVDDACGHERLGAEPAFLSLAARSSPAPRSARPRCPRSSTRLMRDVAPPTIATRPGGTPTALASTRQSAAFASPSIGSARTRTASTARPSDSVSMPSTASRPPFGVSRTVTVTPSGAAVHGRAMRVRSRWDRCSRG